jgi:hypothetical protein
VVQEGLTVDELHGEKPPALVGQQLVERHPVRVEEILQRAKLALEAHQRVGAGALQQLHGDERVSFVVVGLIHAAPAARAEHPGRRIAARAGEGLGRHARCMT